MSQAPLRNTADPLRPLRIAGRDGARLEIYPYGAHVGAWIPAGEEQSRLFLSSRSEFRDGVPIRGGVPVIFPQFAAHGPLPKHGFARVQAWTPLVVEPDAGHARFQLLDSAASRALWPHAFAIELDILARGRQLQLQLEVHNTGRSDFRFTTALHTYLKLADIRRATVEGLQGLRYLDAVRSREETVETAAALAFGEWTDRIYFDAPAELLLREPQRALRIRQQGFRDNVIWNPAVAGSAAIQDLAADDWRELLCIEAATTLTPIELAPGETWCGIQTLIAE